MAAADRHELNEGTRAAAAEIKRLRQSWRDHVLRPKTQVERMNRTIKEATVKRFHYEAHHQLRRHLADFVDAYNFASRLKTLKGLTPCEAICKTWTNDAKRFNLDPFHQMPGLNM